VRKSLEINGLCGILWESSIINKMKKGLNFDVMSDEALEIFVHTVLNGAKIDMTGDAGAHNAKLIRLFEPYGIYDCGWQGRGVSAICIATWKGNPSVIWQSHNNIYVKNFSGEAAGTVAIFMDILKMVFREFAPTGTHHICMEE
jgi:hypothetical protein